MVAQEFTAELKKLGDQFNWVLSKKRQIRGTLKNGQTRELFDPITAVCYKRTGKFFTEDEWIAASNEIGLSLIAAGDIRAATEKNLGMAPHKTPNGASLRQDLIDALKLGPVASTGYRTRLEVVRDYLTSF